VTVRVGLGYDVHAFAAESDPEPAAGSAAGALVLGGVVLEGPRLVGHSDADAVAHAVADALLGPAALPDLGTLYPASDDRYRGASSMELLRDVVARVVAEGWTVANVDVVIAAERPRLAPHVATMAQRLAEVLQPAQGLTGDGVFVSVKPKRGEGIGAVGRAEGIACWAVALLERAEGAASRG
jgi:2-C-methyl-D-erythritol 2,4-cyclodiphosphate synthase